MCLVHDTEIYFMSLNQEKFITNVNMSTILMKNNFYYAPCCQYVFETIINIVEKVLF